MGVVYEAFDPQLERLVAIKTLRASTGTLASGTAESSCNSLLLEEARAVARLSHPNIMAVYDVGVCDAQAYMACELIRGMELAHARAEFAAPWRVVLKWMIDAGHGLSYAHDHGLVHRDFKPANVMLDESGRVLVLDFGVAAESAGPPAAGKLELVRSTQSRDRDDARLLSRSQLTGTPVYMAPELLSGAQADAQSDIFSFCVSLFELLYGHRPFAGPSPRELHRAMLEGPQWQLADSVHRRPPNWLRDLLARGLAYKRRDRRHESLADLIAELELGIRAHDRRRIHIYWGAGLLASLSLSPMALADDPTDPCETGAEKVAAVWNDDQRGRVQSTLQQLEFEYAASTWTRIEAGLDDYAQDWRTGYAESCAAAQVDRLAGPHALDLHMACLDRRLQGFASFVSVLEKADATVLRNAVKAMHALAAIEDCQGSDAAQQIDRRPTQPERRARFDQIEGELTQLDAMINTGQGALARQRALEIRGAVEQLDHPDTSARFTHMLGQIVRSAGEHRYAVELHRFALTEAIHADNLDIAAQAALELVFLRGYSLNERAAMPQLLTRAAALVRAGGNTPALRAALSSYRGIAAGMVADHSSSAHWFEQAVAAQREAPGDESLAVDSYMSNLALAWSFMGKHDKALQIVDQALHGARDYYGHDHPALVSTLVHKTSIAMDAGRWSLALASARQARQICVASSGRVSLRCSVPGVWLAFLLRDLGHFSEAAALHSELMAVQNAAGERGSVTNEWAVVPAASIALSRGQLELADRWSREGLARYAEESSPGDFVLVAAHRARARVDIELGRYESAQRHILDARAILSAPTSTSASSLQMLAHTQARLALTRAQPERAIALLTNTPASNDGSGSSELACRSQRCLELLVSAHHMRGDWAAAQHSLDELDKVLDRRFPSDHHLRTQSHYLRGRLELAQHRPEAADAHLSRALTLLDYKEYEELTSAKIWFARAQAWSRMQPQSPDRRARATEMAQRALAIVEQAPLAPPDQLRTIRNWLDQRR